VFRYANLQKQHIINKISELDKLNDDDTLEKAQRIERRELFDELNLVCHREEAMWKKKSIPKWIGKGDSNSKYFHSIVNWRRKKNEIKCVGIIGQWCEKPDVVKWIVMDYFKERIINLTPLKLGKGKWSFKR